MSSININGRKVTLKHEFRIRFLFKMKIPPSLLMPSDVANHLLRTAYRTSEENELIPDVTP